MAAAVAANRHRLQRRPVQKLDEDKDDELHMFPKENARVYDGVLGALDVSRCLDREMLPHVNWQT